MSGCCPEKRARVRANSCSATVLSTYSFFTCRRNSTTAPTTKTSTRSTHVARIPRTTQIHVRLVDAIRTPASEAVAPRRPTLDRCRCHRDALPPENVRLPPAVPPAFETTSRARGASDPAPICALPPSTPCPNPPWHPVRVRGQRARRHAYTTTIPPRRTSAAGYRS